MQSPPSDSIHGERRQCRRYELELEAFCYTVQSSRRQTFLWPCKVHNISSSGLLLRCGRQLAVDTYVLVSVSWPVPAESGKLRLVVTGAVVWSTEEYAAIAVDRHEFVPESAQPHPGSDWTFPLRIPLRQRRLRTEAAQAASTPKPAVLLVEDSDVQSVLAPLLEGYGYAVESVDRARAMEILTAGNRPVCLLISNNMDGFQMFADRVPVILTVSDNASPAADAALARRIVRKPLFFREIVSAVRELTDAPRAAANTQRSNIC